MNEKITCFLLVCLVAMLIIYGWSNIALSSPATQSIGAVASEPITVAEDTSQNVKLAYPLGDPIDDPVPHRY